MNQKKQKNKTGFSPVKCLPARALAQAGQMSNVQRGSLLLEAFIAIMIIGVAFAVILDVGTLAIKNSTSIRNSSQANFLLRESMETVRSFRDGTTWSTNGLGTVNTGSASPYYFALDTSITPNRWVLTSGTETTGIFTRKIVFDKASRDPSTQNIESTYNASHDDPNTKKATATVTWPGKTLQLISYFTNWK